MTIDNKKFFSPALKGEVAGPIIDIVIAIRALRDLVEDIAAKVDIDAAAQLSRIDVQLVDLNTAFDSLTGYNDD